VIDATELALRIRRREISPVEALAEHQSRIDRLNPALNAIVTEAPDAEERAGAAEAAVLRGDELGPLHGVPFTVKDTFDTAGIRTTRGSRLFAGCVPERDATVVSRAKAAGAVLLGKTNTPEFALWWETANLVLRAHIESARPAAELRRLERRRGGGRRHRHVVARARQRSRRLDPAAGAPLRGRRAQADPRSRPADWALPGDALPLHPRWPARPQRARRRARTGGARGTGWTHTAFGAVEDEIASAVEHAARALADSGAVVEPAEPAGFADVDSNALTLQLYGVEAGAYFDELVGDRRGDLHPAMQQRLDLPRATLAEYVAAEAAVERLRRDLASFFRRYDVLLCETAPVVAPPHDAEEIRIGGAAFAPRVSMRATIPFDLTGSPALTVPFARSLEGLPIAVQLVGRRFEDETVLRAGAAVEAAAS
jgi:Asp-tRNA(Asn)/Glu-tRNA(Gln) amidotransferase A subunit family amidase